MSGMRLISSAFAKLAPFLLRKSMRPTRGHCIRGVSANAEMRRRRGEVLMRSYELARAFLIAAVTIGAVTAGSRPSSAGYALGVPSIPPPPVVQGGSGTITLVVINGQNFPVVLDSTGTVTFHLDFTFPDNDVMDEVTKATRTGGSCGVGTILEPIDGNCTIVLGFVTDDPRRPLDPDVDSGVWDVVDQGIKSHNQFDATNTSNDFGFALVAVLDPGAPNPIPEPTTLLVLLTALGNVVLVKKLSANHRT